MTILPDEKIRAVVFGSLIRMMTAANLFGLYSAFLHYMAISLSFKLTPKFAVETIFCKTGVGISAWG
jgi:hypothetical protein